MAKTTRLGAVSFLMLSLLGWSGFGTAYAGGLVDEAKVQRGRSAAMVPLLEAMARNPEVFDEATLGSYQATLGAFKNNALGRDEGVQIAHFQACAALFANVARQPEVADSLSQLLRHVSGTAQAYRHLTPAGEAERMAAIGVLFASVARQPEATAELNDLATLFCGTIDEFGPLRAQGRIARLQATGVLIDSIARQPEMAGTLSALAVTYLGATDSAASATPAVRAARFAVIGSLCDTIAGQPEAAPSIVAAARQFCGPAHAAADRRSAEAMAAYMRAVGGMLESIAMSPDAADAITAAFAELSGGPFAGVIELPAARGAALETLGVMARGVSRNPELKATLEALFTTYTGCVILPGA